MRVTSIRTVIVDDVRRVQDAFGTMRNVARTGFVGERSLGDGVDHAQRILMEIGRGRRFVFKREQAAIVDVAHLQRLVHQQLMVGRWRTRR